MGAGSSSSNNPVVLGAKAALDQFKYEVANELNIDTTQIQNGYWGYMTSRDCGAVGGNMVRRMIQLAEEQLLSQYQSGRTPSVGTPYKQQLAQDLNQYANAANRQGPNANQIMNQITD